MGNDFSTSNNGDDQFQSSSSSKQKSGYSEFFSSAGKTIGEASGIVCGSLNDAFEEGDNKKNRTKYGDFIRSPGRRKDSDGHDLLCGDGQFTPNSRGEHTFGNPDDTMSLTSNPMSSLFARALLTEVTDNPATMRPGDMAAREKKLILAQEKAKSASKNNLRAVGGQGTMKGQLNTLGQNASSRIMPPSMLLENRAQVRGEDEAPIGKYRVTIGLMLSRRDPKLGHSDTVTRQTAFDFNELQDRQYKYVSSTDSSGWRAGGGESGKSANNNNGNLATISNSMSDETDPDLDPGVQTQQQAPKVPAQDTVHIPIIHIDCDSPSAIDSIIAALARGEVFIPHMSVLPEALGVNGISPPDLVVRFGCERNEDMPPELWPNWCLEFMHNQLYDYFSDMGANWMKRPFQITLAKKVRWKTVKHMNKFFSHSEDVINAWREKGPQYLDPHPSYIEGGASPEEVARPHGIYLLRNGKPTNYFAPNFEPPYTTKMTRSLLLNVMGKSWDRKRRDWSSEPLARVTTSLLLSTMCGCAEPNNGGFIAREATAVISPYTVKSKQSFFGPDTHINIPTTNNTDYSPFKKKKTVQTPELADKGTQHFDGLKIKREDSGIRRSKIATKHYDESQNNSNAVGSSLQQNYSLVSTTSEKQAPNSPVSQDSQSMQIREQSSSIEEPSFKVHEDRYSSQLDVDSFSKDFNLGPNDLDEENFDMEIETPKNYFSSTKETPLINNQHKQRNRKTKHEDKYLALDKTKTLSEDSGSHYEPNKLDDHIEKSDSRISRSQSNMNQDAGMSISVGESQTTVPIMNGSSAKFIEEERQRRKERELQRQKEREKMDQLERAIEEKKRMNQQKAASTPQRQSPELNVRDQDSIDRKSSKKEKKAKKDKKKREKKEKRERERSDDSKISRKIENTSVGKNIDWSIESLSHQAVKENYPIKNDPQSLRENSYDSKPKKAVDWSNDSSYLPVNLHGNMMIDSPSSSKQSIFNTNSSYATAPDLSSQVSLDYSLDTAGDGSLIGGQFAGDASVFTTNTAASDNKSLLSCVTRSTIHEMSGRNKQASNALDPLSPMSDRSENDDDISLSLMASTSSGMELIPTDEELFAIGWAKALDPNSGSYYYFTLDRSKTCWDNPLTS